jgi:hypothetical protein
MLLELSSSLGLYLVLLSQLHFLHVSFKVCLSIFILVPRPPNSKMLLELSKNVEIESLLNL